jgi:hypothetical protein
LEVGAAAEGLRVGSRFSEGRLGYGVDSPKSENIGWIMGYRGRVAVSTAGPHDI